VMLDFKDFKNLKTTQVKKVKGLHLERFDPSRCLIDPGLRLIYAGVNENANMERETAYDSCLIIQNEIRSYKCEYEGHIYESEAMSANPRSS